VRLRGTLRAVEPYGRWNNGLHLMIDRIAASATILVLLLVAVGRTSADTIGGAPKDGIWTYGRYTTPTSSDNVVLSSLYISTGVVSLLGNNEVSPGREALFDLSGSGQMSLLTSDPKSPDLVFSTITWQSDELTLGAGFTPSFVTWTAQSAGQYVVSASFTTGQSGTVTSAGLAAPLDSPGGLTLGSESGFVPYSTTVLVKPGDTIGLLAWDGTSSGDESAGLRFQFAPVTAADPPDPVPEPSRVVALLGLASMVVVGCLWDWRRHRSLDRLRRPASLAD
jgi:hypothetical protein